MSAAPIDPLRPNSCHSPLSDILLGKLNYEYAKLCNSFYHIKIALGSVCFLLGTN